MRNIALGILAVILLSIIVEPLVELGLVFREKVALSTAINNSCRAAKDRSLDYELLRGLDADIDEKRFRQYFAEAFEDALNLSVESIDDNTLIFTSNDDRYNTFKVTLEFTEEENPYTEQLVSTVEVVAESDYKFKTKYLKLAEAADRSVDYQLVSEREYTLSVKN